MILSVVAGVLAALLAWQMQDVIGILLLAFTVNTAALFVPTIAMVTLEKPNTRAAFWSITLSLMTVVGWYVASVFELAPIFSLDPLWPGLTVSILSFGGISLFATQPGDYSVPVVSEEVE